MVLVGKVALLGPSLSMRVLLSALGAVFGTSSTGGPIFVRRRAGLVRAKTAGRVECVSRMGWRSGRTGLWA